MLENKIYVFDDLVPQNYQNYLEDFCYNTLPFFLIKLNSAGDSSFQSTNYQDIIYDKPQMFHSFIENGEVVSPYYNIIFPLFNYIHSDFNYIFNYKILRAKSNLKHSVKPKYKDKFNPPHVDYIPPIPNTWVLLYYIIDSDGDTVIFNESYTDSKIINFSIKQTISPKKGRLLFFPSTLYHSANFPINNQIRLVLNTILEIFPK